MRRIITKIFIGVHACYRMLVAVLIGMLLTSALVVPAYADGIPGGNVADPVVRAVDIAKPAVVRIITSTNSRLAVKFPPTTEVTFPQGDGVASKNSYLLQVSGSGTFITANGDILTADHVVNPPKDQALQQILYDAAKQDIANYINRTAKPGSPPVTPDQVMQQLVSGQLQSTPQYNTPMSEVFLSTDYTGPLTASDFANIPAQIHATVDQIKKESPVDQKDIAIIHAPFTDTPSVQLADSTTVQQQDTLTIIGFPGNADISTRPTDILTSSVNKINVSSIKTTDAGAQVIQVGGNVEHGDSGGPALDSTGAVVGIVSFALASSNSPGSTSFLQTSNNARELVDALKLNTAPGTFQQQWKQAFNDYAATTPGHWQKAQQGFQDIATKYPLFKAVTPYLNYAQTQAAKEKAPLTQPSPTPRPTPGNTNVPATTPLARVPAILWTVGAILLVLVLAVALFGVMVRQRKKKSAAVPTTAGKAEPPAASAPVKDKSSPSSNAQVAPAKPVPVQPQPTPSSSPTASPTKQPAASSGTTSSSPSAGGSNPLTGAGTLTLRAWPCGHMNRPNARFCSICGEAAPMRKQ